MFNIGAGETLLIALVLLIAVGPEQLPGLIRRAGKTMGQLRSMSEGLRRDFMSSMDELERASDPRKWAEGGKESDDRPAYLPIDRELGRADADDSGDEADEPEAETDTEDETPTFSGAKISVAPPFSSSADLEALKNGDGTAPDGDNPADDIPLPDDANDATGDDTTGETDGTDHDGPDDDVEDVDDVDDADDDRAKLTTDSGYDNLVIDDGPALDDPGGGGTDTEDDRGVVS